tara:strand:- start:106 stop:963 length:858 start_codon:yes stop_codon:yes gene_type:complete
MKKNNHNSGFTLILSLVLLLVMSLMGGTLIVISSGDHQSNNTSDQYQQTFYVAEHALLEAEKQILNRMIGPWTEVETIKDAPVGSRPEEIIAHDNYITQLKAIAIDGIARHTDGRGIPRNLITPTQTPCFKSFRNLIREQNYYYTKADVDALNEQTPNYTMIGTFLRRGSVLVTDHKINENFGNLIEPILDNPTKSQIDLNITETAKEKEYLKRFRYEFFSINVGSANFKGAGTSVKKTSTNMQRQGTAYRIYGCGYLMPNGTDLDDYDNPDILIPLESLVILSG